MSNRDSSDDDPQQRLGEHEFDESTEPSSKGAISPRMVAIAAIVLILVALSQGYMEWFSRLFS